MKESEYIAASNVQKFRYAAILLRDVYTSNKNSKQVLEMIVTLNAMEIDELDGMSIKANR